MHKYMPSLEGENLVIGVTRARFQEELGDELYSACIQELLSLGVKKQNIYAITVPGSLEVPLALRQLAQSGPQFDALIALGIVMRGDTYHFEIVSDVSARAVMQVSLELDLAIGNAILTVENEQQAKERVQEKGKAVSVTVVEMANYRRILKLSSAKNINKENELSLL